MSSSKILNSTSNSNYYNKNDENKTPPDSPFKRNSKLKLNSLPTTKSIEAWRNLEIKLDKVINQLNYDNTNNTTLTNNNNNNSPSKSFKSINSITNLPKSSLDSNLSPSSSSNSSTLLHFTEEDLTISTSKQQQQIISSTKQPSKFKSFLRLRSTSTSNSATSTSTSSSIKPSSSSAKRSNSSTRPIARDQIDTTTDLKTLPTSSLSQPTTVSIPSVQSTSTAVPVVAPVAVPRLRKAQSLIQLSSSWFNKKFDSTSTTTTTTDPIPSVPSLPIQFQSIPIANSPDLLESNWNSPVFSFDDSSRMSTPTLIDSTMSTPVSLSSSTFSISTGRFVNPTTTTASTNLSLSTHSPPRQNPTSNSNSTSSGPIDLLISFSNRFRNNLNMFDNTSDSLSRNSSNNNGGITDEELISWRKDVNISGRGRGVDGNIKRSVTALGERIILSPRKITFTSTRRTTFGKEEEEQDEEEPEEETLIGLGFNTSSSPSNSSTSISTNTTSSSSSSHKLHPHFSPSTSQQSPPPPRNNPSQSPSLPSSSYNQKRILIRSVSTSSLPTNYRRGGAGGGLEVPGEFGGSRKLNRKLSFTPISISPAASGVRSLTPLSMGGAGVGVGVRRRLELVEVFPLPPIRM